MHQSLTFIAISSFSLLLATASLAAESSSDTSKTGLRAAVQAALEHTPGQVLEADQERGEKTYEIDIVHDGQITEVDVDATTGKVIKTETETDKIKHHIKKALFADKTLTALKNAKVSLPDAITKAEDTTHAKAVAAEFDHEDGQYVYEIKLKADDKQVKTYIDANSGEVKSDK